MLDIEPEINKNPYRTKAQYYDDLTYIKDNFNVLGLEELIEIASKGRKFPERSLLITFDDGLAIQYDHIYPILKSQNLPATFFINNAFIDNQDLHYERKKYILLRRLNELRDNAAEREIFEDIYLTDSVLSNQDLRDYIRGIKYKSKGTLDLIAEKMDIPFSDYLRQNRIYLSTREIDTMLSNGMTIGGHSIDHPDFTELSLEEQVHQTLSSVNDLADRFELAYKAFAFPYNDSALDTRLFERIRGDIDISFGASGLARDEFRMHFQRGSIDNSSQRFDRALAVLFSKYYGMRVGGRHHIKRY
jgi:peptidoglycan/xylan/chitin deacetylase (PgdA/CDA1 family)